MLLFIFLSFKLFAKFLKNCLLIYFWLCWVFIAVRDFLYSCQKRRLLFSCDAPASHCGGFSCCRAWALEGEDVSSCGPWAPSCGSQAPSCGPWAPSCGLWAPSCGSQALKHRFKSCGAHGLHGMWDFPGSGIKPLSPASADEFFTTEPSGKPWL